MENIINQDLFKDYQTFIYPIIVCIFIIIFFYRRAKSNFSIIHRILLFILGREESKNSNNDLINDVLEIEKFNFYYNTNAYTLKQKKKFEKWIREYEIDYRLISKLGSSFNIEDLKISTNKIHSRCFFFVIIMLYGACLGGTISLLPNIVELATKDSALLKLNESKKWYWINNQEAEKFVFWSDKTVNISKEKCNKDNYNTDITESDIKIVCNILTTNEDNINKFIIQSIKEQQVLAYIILFSLLFFFIYFGLNIYKVGIIIDANEMIRKKMDNKKHKN